MMNVIQSICDSTSGCFVLIFILLVLFFAIAGIFAAGAMYFTCWIVGFLYNRLEDRLGELPNYNLHRDERRNGGDEFVVSLV